MEIGTPIDETPATYQARLLGMDQQSDMTREMGKMEADERILPLVTYLRSRPEVVIARPTLGLTLYTADPLFWAQRGARALFERYCEIAGDQLRFFTTSTHTGWRKFEVDDLPNLAHHLTLSAMSHRVRNLFEFRAADTTAAATRSFTYRELDPERSDRTGYVQLLFEPDFDPDEVFQLAIQIAQEFPIYSGLGGWTMSISRRFEREAFDRIHAQCKRFLALDAQRADSMAYHTRAALPGTSWLTLIGTPLCEHLELSGPELAAHPWKEQVAVMPLGAATLIRAGERPTLGDVNLMQYPSAISEVAHRLAPYQANELPILPGPFSVEDTSARWRNRFVEPTEWM